MLEAFITVAHLTAQRHLRRAKNEFVTDFEVHSPFPVKDSAQRRRRLTSPNMSSPGAGFEYPRTDVAWVKRDILLFAATIGCKADELHFLYVRR